VIFLSEFLQHYWWALIIGAVVGFRVFKSWHKTPGGTMAVILIYVLANIAYLSVLDVNEIRTSKLVAADVAEKLIGRKGVIFVSVTVMLSTFGTLSSVLLTSPRILFALAVPLLWLAWLRYLFSQVGGSDVALPSLFGWTLVAASLFCGLLLLELRDKLALKSDLEVARQIQFGLLPFEPYERDGVAIRAAMRPANTVGGDYFDVIDLGGGKIAAVMGDVAGKGMPAALLMALLQGSLRTLITAGFRGPEVIAKLNAHLFANIPSNRLVTLFYAELDTVTGSFVYVNAGHNPPYRLDADGGLEPLTATGMALGIVPAALFESREARLDPGDRIFLFTDGITEAFDLRDAEYGEARLEAYLAAARGAGDQELIDGVRADVMAFCGSSPPRDDMTLMVVARRA